MFAQINQLQSSLVGSCLLTCSASIHNPSLGEFVLQLQHGKPSFCRFGRSDWTHVFGFVTLVIHNLRRHLVKGRTVYKDLVYISDAGETTWQIIIMFFLKGYDSIKVLPTPVEKLLESGLVLPSRLALSDQRRVGGEYHTFLHTPIVFRGDFPIFELKIYNHVNEHLT